jgi:hypothetical protein
MSPARVLCWLALIVLFDGPAEAKESFTECESWNGGRELRCLSQGAGAAIGGAVTVYNPGNSTITFFTQVRKGVCKESSSDASARRDHALPPEAGEDILLDPHYIGPGPNTACTELFVFDCRHSGIARFCQGTIQAFLKEQDSWPPGPPRDCATGGDGKIDCSSWSFKQGVPHEPGSVTLRRLSSSGPVLTVELHEYQSTCGSIRMVKTGPAAMGLDPGETGVYRLNSDQGDVPAQSDLCVGLLITQCTLGGARVKCTDHVHATVQ